jgi:uracil-DNA glycosylase family 4
MFTGDRSGDWLFEALWRAGFANQPQSVDRQDGLVLNGAWVTAAVRCAPPDNRPSTEEKQTCLSYLIEELALLERRRVVVALGQIATDSLARIFAIRPRPKFAHLAEYPLGESLTMVCSYHPSQRNTFTNLLTKEMFDAVFARARELSGTR